MHAEIISVSIQQLRRSSFQLPDYRAALTSTIAVGFTTFVRKYQAELNSAVISLNSISGAIDRRFVYLFKRFKTRKKSSYSIQLKASGLFY